MADRKNNNEIKRNPENWNILSVLLASEAMKKEAAERRITLDEDMMALCRTALSILREDKAVFTYEYLKKTTRKAGGFGTIAARLSLGEAEYTVDSDEMIESRKEGGAGRERAFPEMKSMPDSFRNIANSLDYAVPALERAVKNGSWSVLDAEKALRCVAYLAQPNVRKAAKALLALNEADEPAGAGTPEYRKKAGSRLMMLSKKGDELLEGDLYAVSRRLVLASCRGSALDEMDGILKVNPVNGKSEELAVFEELDFRIDSETGIRYLTPSSLIDYAKTITSRRVDGNSINAGGGSFHVNLTDRNQAILEDAVRKAAAGGKAAPSPEHTETMKAAEKFFYDLIRRYDDSLAAGRGSLQSDAAREAEYAKVEKSLAGFKNGRYARWFIKNRLDRDFASTDWIQQFAEPKVGWMKDRDGSFSLSHIGAQKGEDDTYSEADLVRIPYHALYRTYADLKAFCINASINAGFKLPGSKEVGIDSTPEFAFDADIPIKSSDSLVDGRDPSKPMTLYHESMMTILRVDALLTGYIAPSSIKGAELIERAAQARKKAVGNLFKAKTALMDTAIGFEEEEVEKKFREALEGRDLKPVKEGWFKTEELRALFIESAGRALDAMTHLSEEDPDLAITTAAAALLDAETGAKVNDSAPGREVKTITEDGGSYRGITPPAVNALTPAAQFRVLTGFPLTSANDSSVKDSDGFVYYDQTDWEVYYSRLKAFCTAGITRLDGIIKKNRQSRKKESPDYLEAEKSFQTVMKLVNAVRKAGGGHTRCVAIMEDAFEKAKDIYINTYIDNLKKLKAAYAMTDAFNLDGTPKESGGKSSLMNDLMTAGKAYGEFLMCGIAAEALSRMGWESDAAAVSAFSRADAESGKWRLYEELSPLAKYIMSRVSIAITSSAVTQIEKDALYYESRAAYESNWHEMERTKSDTNYNALVKSTLPFMTDESLEKEFGELVLDRETAAALALSFASSKLQKEEIMEGFKGYRDEYMAAFRLRREETRKELQEVDIRAAQGDAERLRRLIMFYRGSDAEKREVEETLEALTAHNPLMADRVSAFRGSFVEEAADFNSWKVSLLKKVDDLKYMTAIARRNSGSENKGRLLELEEDYAAEIRRRAVVKRNEIEAETGILSEKQLAMIADGKEKRSPEELSCGNLALADTALTGLFSKESRLLDNLMMVMPEDMMRSLGGDVKAARTALRGMLKLIEDGVDNDVYMMVSRSAERSFALSGVSGGGRLPAARFEKTVKLPLGDGVFSVDFEDKDNALEKAGYVRTENNETDLRGRNFSSTMAASFNYEKDQALKPFLSRNLRGTDIGSWWNEALKYSQLYPEKAKRKDDGSWKSIFSANRKDDVRGPGRTADGRTFDASAYIAVKNEAKAAVERLRSGGGEEDMAAWHSAAERLSKAIEAGGIRKDSTRPAVFESREDGSALGL